MNEFIILFPEKEVELACGPTVQVRALRWNESLEFISKLTALVLNNAGSLASLSAGGIAALTPELIRTVMTSSSTLVEWLLTRTVNAGGAMLTDNQLATLPAVDVLRLLDASIELNLSEEVIGLGKTIGGRLAHLAAKRPASATSTATSSATGTPAKN